MKNSKKRDLWYKEEHQKAGSKVRFLARGKIPKCRILYAKKNIKKNNFMCEEKHQKTQSNAYSQTTNLCLTHTWVKIC